MTALKAQILCHARRGVTLAFKLEGAESIVGRDPGLKVSVPLDGVSRQHAKFVYDGKNYWLEDLTSTNGTFLNGAPVKRERLRHLDVITLGKTANLIFVLRSEEEGTVTTRGIVKASLVLADGEAVDVPQGEFLLGRSSACNVVAESSVVSKLHAKIVRTPDQLVVQDLGSANGTFVNGSRVMTAVLRDGDVLSLGGVEPYRIATVMGEITSASGVRRAMPADIAPPAKSEAPQLSREWKTRFDWDPAEREAIAAVLQKVDAERAGSRGETAKAPVAGAKGEAPTPSAGRPKAVPPAKPAPVAKAAPAAEAKAAAAGAATPPVAAAAKPPAAATAKPPAAPTAKPPVAPVAKATAAAPVSSPAPATPAAPAAPAPAATPAPRPAAAPAPAPAPEARTLADRPAPAPAAAAPARITAVHLTGGGVDAWIREPGAYEIGRGASVAFRVDNPTVSRRHARVELAADRSEAWVEDLGAANRVRVNGEEVTARRALVQGDTLGLGDIRVTVTIERG